MPITCKKLVIGFITYGNTTAKYLPYFLPSLANQTFKDYYTLVIDNSEKKENRNREYLKKHYPDIDIEWPGENIGFARANNKIISRARELGVEYVMLLNPDIVLEPIAVAKMIEAMDEGKTLGSVSAKIYQWNFLEQKKTNIIDSCGIYLKPGLRFFDLGQAQADKGQCDREEILGPSGTAPMYRLSALEKIKQGSDEYFDEIMFMYKEDCDLAYRLSLASFKSKLIDDAIIFHDRSAGGRGEKDIQVALNRCQKSRWIKEMSFFNQHIMFVKYWRAQNAKEKAAMLAYVFKILVFVLIFEQYLLGQYVKFWKIRKKILKYQI